MMSGTTAANHVRSNGLSGPRVLGIACAVVALVTVHGWAAIVLELRPLDAAVNPGETVNVQMVAIPMGTDNLSGGQVLFGWDPAKLQFTGLDNTGSELLSSEISPLPDLLFGVNEADPPQDGDGFWNGFALPVVSLDPAGTILTTFQFTALGQTPGTAVALLDGLQKAPELSLAATEIYGDIPGLDVLDRPVPVIDNTVVSTSIVVVPEPITLILLLSAGILLGFRRVRPM